MSREQNITSQCLVRSGPHSMRPRGGKLRWQNDQTRGFMRMGSHRASQSACGARREGGACAQGGFGENPIWLRSRGGAAAESYIGTKAVTHKAMCRGFCASFNSFTKGLGARIVVTSQSDDGALPTGALLRRIKGALGPCAPLYKNNERTRSPTHQLT